MVRKNYLWVLLVAAVLALALPEIVCAETASVIRKTVVRAEPGHQYEQTGLLAAEQKVELLQRQGGWYQVDFDGQSGWVPLLSIRKGSGEAPKKQKASGLRGLLSTYRTGSSGVTVATGVRGLDAVDLENSKPDFEELKRLDQHLVSADDARNYAGQVGLVSRDVAWIQPDGKGR